MNPLNAAVIGAGHLGTIHTRLLHQNQRFNLLGVVEPDEAAQRKIADEFSIPVVPHIRELPGTPEAVVIATPTATHYPVAAQYLKRGVHALVEKPLTISVQQADHLIELADQHNVILQVGHNERFNSVFDTARRQHPKSRYIEAARTSTYTFRSTDVGVVLDLMIHDLDLVLSLVDSPLIQVNAVGTAVFGQHEDIAQARLQFANGCVANLTASRCSFERQRWIRWFSEDGFVSANLDEGKVKSIAVPGWLRNQERQLNDLPKDQQAVIRDSLFEKTLPLKIEDVPAVNAIEQEHNDFAEAILHDRQPLVSGRAGRDALAAAEDILEAIANHNWRAHSAPLRKAA